MVERVLIVDDSFLVRQMVQQELAALGYSDVGKATNGREAWSQLVDAHANGAPFSIVFLDWLMPEMNGYDFLVRCRNDERFAKTAIVMVTAEAEDRHIMQALSAGATAYVVKPYTREALEKKVKQAAQWLAKQRAGAEESPQ